MGIKIDIHFNSLPYLYLHNLKPFGNKKRYLNNNLADNNLLCY